MIRIKVGDQLVEVPGHLLAQAVVEHLPGWLMGKEPPANGTQGAFRFAVKGLIPLAFSLMHMDTVAKGLHIPAPNLKSKEAKQNIIAYAVAYLLGNATAVADSMVFTVEGEESNGVIRATGLTATPATLAPVEEAGTDHPRIASPVV